MALERGFTPIHGSTHFHSMKYDGGEHKLTLQFQNGYRYVVHGIAPEAVRRFLDAPSQGEHFHYFIKDSYPVERVK